MASALPTMARDPLGAKSMSSMLPQESLSANFRRHMQRKFWFSSELRRGRVGLETRRVNTSMKCNQHKPAIHKAAQTSNTQGRTGRRRNSWYFRPVRRLGHIAALNRSEDSPEYPVATEFLH